MTSSAVILDSVWTLSRTFPAFNMAAIENLTACLFSRSLAILRILRASACCAWSLASSSCKVRDGGGSSWRGNGGIVSSISGSLVHGVLVPSSPEGSSELSSVHGSVVSCPLGIHVSSVGVVVFVISPLIVGNITFQIRKSMPKTTANQRRRKTRPRIWRGFLVVVFGKEGPEDERVCTVSSDDDCSAR